MKIFKPFILTVLIILMLLDCVACARKATGTQAADAAPSVAEEMETASTTAAIETNTITSDIMETTVSDPAMSDHKSDAGSSADWIKEGNYIDKEENHLALYYQTVANGYKKDGWASISMLRGSIYNGEMTEENGILYGTLTAYKSDGTPGDTMQVVILEGNGDSIVLSTNDGMDYTFDPDNADYSK